MSINSNDTFSLTDFSDNGVSIKYKCKKVLSFLKYLKYKSL